jgi:hypothetical protein
MTTAAKRRSNTASRNHFNFTPLAVGGSRAAFKKKSTWRYGMGSNTTQAQGLVLFLIGFTFVAGGFAADIGYLYIAIGLALVGASIALFLKAKAWDHNE